MTSYKKITCFLVSLLMVLSLTACGPEDPKSELGSTPSFEQNAAPTGTEQNTVDNSSTKALLAATPAHISEVFSESFTVEADVHVPNVQKADVLFAKCMQFDEQKLLSIFYNGKAPHRETHPVDDAISYTDDSSYIMIYSGAVFYRTQDFNYVKFPTESFASANDIFSASKKFDEVYVQENLGFMTRVEALETVSSILRQLSIDTTGNAKIYAIDFKTMQAQQEERIQREIDYQNAMGISPIHDPKDGYQTKSAFTQDDDFYILYITMMQNDIPVTQQSYETLTSERLMNGSTARVSFSKKGIIELECGGIYQQQGIAESPSTLISVEEALQNAYEKHNAIISTDKAIVTAIDFEYVPVPYNDNYDEVKLTPAWNLTLTYERDMPSKHEKETSGKDVATRMVFINAVTGEEIR